ncbi:ABC transporter ATP-binding protein [Thiorhodococcus fuscus]|uniref:ABC transporter ATP-binding protein n=1 Tax=Thiorhodococcus fuscus TaxID=527200 RepID=A0ABW4Y781_9GAMM
MFQLMAGRRIALLAALLVTLVAVIAELVPFWLLFRAIDALLVDPQDLPSTLLSCAVWLLVALLLKYLAYGVAYLISHHTAYAIMADTRQRLVSQLAAAPLHWLLAQGAGALKQSVIQDVERMEAFIAHHTVEVTAAVLAPLVVTGLLFWVDWRLALAVLAVGPLAFVSASIVMRGSGQEHERFNRATADLSNVTVEYLRNMPVMKIFCHATSGFRLLQRRLRDYYQLTEDITRRTVPGWSLFTSVLGAHMLLVLPLGAWLEARDEVSAAEVALAVMLGAGVFRPMLKVSRFFMEMPGIFAGLSRMAPILAIGAGPRCGASQIEPPVTLALDRVGFAYGPRSILEDVSLSLTAGSFNVLLGPSGSGKSTIAQIVAGALVPASGTARINGVEIQDLGDAERAALIALATQDVFLFSGTIRDNLRLARPTVSEAQLRRAVEVAQAQTLIEALPDGYETQVSELGARLSGGERQRIAVARALLADTQVLVLDEATAFADSLTQRAFFQALRAAYPDKALLVVAHRLYGIEQADQILVLERGQVTDRGTHAELLRSSVYYRAMWRREQQIEEWTLVADDERPGSGIGWNRPATPTEVVNG